MTVNLTKPVNLTKRAVPNTDTLIRSGLTVTDLVICSDCALMYANGIDPHDEDARAHVGRCCDYSGDMVGTIAVGEHTDEFSSTRCDSCGTDLAGDRWSASLLTPTNPR